MSESKGFWNNATVATVLGGILLAMALGVANYLDLSAPVAFGWLRKVGAFLRADVTLSRWAYWLWAGLTVVMAILIVLQVRLAVMEQADIPAKPTNKPTSYADYRTDLFFGFRWRWTVYAGGTVGKVRMFCPKCDYELSTNDFEQTRTYREYLCRCAHCNFAHSITASGPREMSDRIEKAAERKIRTGEWRQVGK
jgi:hypothetical protein